MFCSNCGAEIAEGSAYCSACGAKTDVDSTASDPVNAQPSTTPPTYTTPEYRMKWHNFLVKFSLWASAVSISYEAISLLFGFSYTTDYYGGKTTNITDLVYAMYDGLQIVDITFAILAIGIAILALVTVFKLSTFKSSGPKLLLGLYASTIVWSIFYYVCAIAIIGPDGIESLNIMSIAMQVIISIVMMIVNYIYYSKRSYWFD